MGSMIDEKTGYFMLDELVFSMPSYRRILADEQITNEELLQQSQDVVGLIRKMEQALEGKELELVWNVIGELAVLFELYSIKEKESHERL